METFSALLAICAGNSPVPGEFPTQRPVTRSFDVYFDLRPNKRLSKQSWGWWFETPSRPLWSHRNESPLRAGYRLAFVSSNLRPNVRYFSAIYEIPIYIGPRYNGPCLVIIGWVSTVLPVQHQATTRTTADLWSTWPAESNFNGIRIKIW